jgi:hypothetical protein
MPDAAASGDDSALDAANAFGASPCGTCLQQACASQIAQCTDDPGCARYMTCLFACAVGADGNADPTCVSGCSAAGSSSSATSEAIGALSACFDTGPGALCVACGGDGGTGYAVTHQNCSQVTLPSNPCYALEESKCCQTLDACAASTACQGLVQCFGACPSSDILPDAGSDAGFPSCNEACIAQYPGGLATFVPFDICFNFECFPMPACGGTPDNCIACLAANCTQATIDMEVAPGGFGVYNCIIDCGADSACQSACKTQYPAAVKALEAYLACQENVCGIACPGSGGV